MMGERSSSIFYEFSLDRHVPTDHMLRAIDRFSDLEGVRTHLATTARAGCRTLRD
jgi:hypothetical protein